MATQCEIIDSKVEQVKAVLMLEKEKQEFIENFPVSKIFTTVKGETFTRKRYSFEVDFPSLETVIFTHGKSNYKIWFLNAKKKLCVIDKAKVKNKDVYLDITIDVKQYQTKTHMSLDRFLFLVEKRDFTITLDKFVETYLKPITESTYYKNKILEFDNKIAEAEKIQY